MNCNVSVYERRWDSASMAHSFTELRLRKRNSLHLHEDLGRIWSLASLLTKLAKRSSMIK